MPTHRIHLAVGLLAALALLAPPRPAAAQQTFVSGSDGSDGALSLTTPGTVLFDPTTFSPPLDVDGDGVYHFTTIEVGPGVTVRLSAATLGTRPVIWLAQGAVIISGTLDLDGEAGHPSGSPSAAIAGAGGFFGGYGSTATTVATPGQGPGGGNPSPTGQGLAAGAGAGHSGQGGQGSNGALGGTVYGNAFLQPLVGGSGGAGGGPGNAPSAGGAGGGAGGGALLIASSTELTLAGSIQARGGNGTQGQVGFKSGGGGSGGAVRLVATTVQGNGSITVARGAAGSGGTEAGPGAEGRVRIEAINQLFSGVSDPSTFFSAPGPIFPPTGAPEVRIVAIDGVSVPVSPTGTFPPADVTLNDSGPVTFSIEASHIPLGTVVRIVMFSEARATLVVDSTPLTGTLEASTATATATVPSGYSRFTVEANWTP
ncbi:MAG: hypothetical protein KDD11_19520 [Acidobacteria bacterium]|nr:hypothetical protein [Acidobacteriota bacterium]